MILRLVVLVATLALAYGAAGLMERRRPRSMPGFQQGITLVTSPGCALCPAIRTVLRDVEVREVDVSAVAGVRSVPTVIVANADGEVILRRSGRSAIIDAPAIIEAAALV